LIQPGLVLTSDRPRRDELVAALRQSKPYRDTYLRRVVRGAVAAQVRTLRESLPATQAELGQLVGMKQTAISRLENPESAGLTIDTLLRLASALDVALIIKFAPYSELVNWVVGFSPGSFSVPAFQDDERLDTETTITVNMSFYANTASAAFSGSTSVREIAQPAQPQPAALLLAATG
jgi:transcriptional regulator with XRE-family HTH domain